MIINLVLLLRERLLNSLKGDDREDLRLLCTTFGVLRETSYSMNNELLTVVLADLEYSAQHGAMGIMAKAMDIPSVEKITSILDEAT